MKSNSICIKQGLIILILMLFGFSQCSEKKKEGKEAIQADSLSKQNKVVNNTSENEIYIGRNVENLLMGERITIAGDSIFSKKVLPQFYQNRRFQPAWQDTIYANAILTMLADADKEGLLKEDYHYQALTSLKKQLKQSKTSSHTLFAQFDLLLTDGILKYGNHLLNGKVLPKEQFSTWNYHERMVGDTIAETLQKSIDTKTVNAQLEKLKPEIRLYGALKKELAFYRTIASQDTLPKIPQDSTLHRYTHCPAVAIIRKRLSILGLYKNAIDLPIEKSQLYDDSLFSAVKQFQALHSLQADGVIGKTTIQEMNISVENRINHIKVNLERLRWVAGSLSAKYIVVNIAGFELYLFEKNKLSWTTNVMTGAVDTETPIFQSKISYLVFNPTWTVPRSISQNSIISHIKRDISYLENNHYTLVNNKGITIAPESINTTAMSANNFPYSVVQTPGIHNSLGRVKFMFPNDYSIYLHDTPSKHLFAKTDRAFSHGCIRVQYPLKLAEILLADSLRWNAQKIEEVIKGETTQTVFLKDKMDIMLMYWTNGIDSTGAIKFYRDIYKRDKMVEIVLNKVI